jgi:hypothetical protein
VIEGESLHSLLGKVQSPSPAKVSHEVAV